MADPRNMLTEGAEFLRDQRQQSASSPVTYRRGATSLQVRARIGRTELDAVSDDGFTTALQTRDFIFSRADLDSLGSGVFTPQDGDQIIEPMPVGNDAVYEPMPMPGGQKWRWSDSSRTSIRVHTKRVL